MESRNGSITPNSMTVLERGTGGASTVVSPTSRPPSGRHSRSRTPIQRSGSQLEVLPPNDLEKVVSSARPSSRSNSAGSSRGRSSPSYSGCQEKPEGLNRSGSLESGLSPRQGGGSRPGSAVHKQVSLTTVKRNFEIHGIPKNESYDFVPKDKAGAVPPLSNGLTHANPPATASSGASGGLSHKAEGVSVGRERGGNGDGVNVMSEQEVTQQRLTYLMEQLSTKNEEIRQHEERRKSEELMKKESEKQRVKPSAVLTDSYYVSTGSVPHTEMATGDRNEKAPPFLEEKKDEGGEDDDEDDDDEDDEEEDEERKAPIELMSEFLDAVMEEEYETADKLCKMILIYEPENAECLQYKPLLQEMVKREWQRQLWGSSSEEESGEDDDDEDDDEDEEDDDDDDDDEDSDEESSDSDSSEESDDEEEDEDEEKEKTSSVIIQPAQDT